MDTRTPIRLGLKGKGTYCIIIDLSSTYVENSFDVVLYYRNKRVAQYTMNCVDEPCHVINLPFAIDLSLSVIRKSGAERDVSITIYKKILWFWRKVKEV